MYATMVGSWCVVKWLAGVWDKGRGRLHFQISNWLSMVKDYLKWSRLIHRFKGQLLCCWLVSVHTCPLRFPEDAVPWGLISTSNAHAEGKRGTGDRQQENTDGAAMWKKEKIQREYDASKKKKHSCVGSSNRLIQTHMVRLHEGNIEMQFNYVY